MEFTYEKIINILTEMSYNIVATPIEFKALELAIETLKKLKENEE